MDFTLKKTQVDIQKAALGFAKGEFDKDAAENMDKAMLFPKDILEKAGELGFIGIHFPDKYMGGGLGYLELALTAEAFCRKDAGIGAALMLSGFASECLLKGGEETLKKKYLSKISEGKMLSGAAFYEKESGADLGLIQTTALKTKDGYVINGEKTHAVNAGLAGLYLVLCKTDTNAAPDKALSLFAVEADRSGLCTCAPKEKLGLRMIASADIVFDHVEIPEINLIGKEGGGLKLIEGFFGEFRLLVAAMALGAARGALDRALTHIRERIQFGRKIGEFQVTRHKIADMAQKIESAAYITYAAAKNLEQKKPDPSLSAMARLTATDAAAYVTSESIQLLGGYGYMTEYEVERFYRDVKAMTVMAETPGRLKDEVAGGIIGKLK